MGEWQSVVHRQGPDYDPKLFQPSAAHYPRCYTQAPASNPADRFYNRSAYRTTQQDYGWVPGVRAPGAGMYEDSQFDGPPGNCRYCPTSCVPHAVSSERNTGFAGRSGWTPTSDFNLTQGRQQGGLPDRTRQMMRSMETVDPRYGMTRGGCTDDTCPQWKYAPRTCSASSCALPQQFGQECYPREIKRDRSMR